MRRQISAIPSSPPRQANHELLFLSIIGVVYWGILGILGWLTQFGGHSPLAESWGRLLLPNIWLFSCSILLKNKFYKKVRFVSGGRWPGIWAVLTGIVVILMIIIALYSPLNKLDDTSLNQTFFHLALIGLAPLTEEIYFRGLLLYHLKNTLGSFAAIVLVSALFGILHRLSGWPVVMAMTIFSGILCAVTLFSQSILWAMAWHLGWNAMAVVRQPMSASSRWGIVALVIIVLITISFWGAVISPLKREPNEPT